MLTVLDCPVLVRAGAEGAYFAWPSTAAPDTLDESATHIPTPRVEAIDTNGAGDAHSGVLAASLAQGIPMERALLLANCAGALSTTVVGPASCPTREEIEAAADALAPDFPQAPKMLLPMYIALLEQSGMPDRREQPACAAALEYLFHRLSGRKVDLRRIAAKNGVSPRLCRMMAKRILRAVKNMAKNKTKGSAEHEVHQL